MADWCHEFDFTRTDLPDPQQGFETFAFGIFETEEGFTDDWGVFYGAAYRGCNIRCYIPISTTIEEIVAEYSATVGANQGNGVNSVLRYNNTGEYTYNTLDTEYPSASTVLSWTGSITNMEYFNVQVTVGYDEVSPITDPGGTVAITRVLVRGSGPDPFNQEYNQQQALYDTFDAIRDALHTDPEADISDEIEDYKDAIEATFGVELSNASGAATWNDSMIALHFLRQGLEAVAEAFEQWVEAEIESQEVCKSVNRFDLFKRITGGLELRNVATEADNVALTEGKLISINRVPNANRQWTMTPNNLIHEIGHSASRSAGFGTLLLGSIEHAIDTASPPPHTDFSRDGMGPLYLREHLEEDRDELYYEHARVEDSNSDDIAEFNTAALGDKPPANFDPSGYLQYDLFATNFNLWDSDYNRYRVINMNARIDIYVQNYPLDTADATTKLVEITADSFLNWVRGTFEGTAGVSWEDFYVDNIGMFLRNAVIYRYPGGMVQFYKDKGIIPQTSITPGTRADDNANVRLTPIVADGNIVGITANVLNSTNIAIYGWSDTNPSGASPYWLLVEDNVGRLVWVASNAIDHDDTYITPQNEIANIESLSPVRPYVDDDLLTIIGA